MHPTHGGDLLLLRPRQRAAELAAFTERYAGIDLADKKAAVISIFGAGKKVG